MPAPRPSLSPRAASLLGLLVLAACESASSEPTPGDAVDTSPSDDAPDDATDASLPPARCNPGVNWDEQTPLFRDATADWGLDAIGAQGVRVNVADIDGDGWPDLLLRRGGTRPEPLTGDEPRSTWLLRNDRGRAFVDVTLDSGLVTLRSNDPRVGRPVDVTAFADIDNDGDLDVYIGIQTADPGQAAGATSEVMRNNGEGLFSFTAESNAVRAPDRIDSPAGATFIDADLDGNVDLWIAQHGHTAGGGFTFLGDVLYRGLGDGTFEDVTAAWGLTTEPWEELDDLDAALAHSRAWSSLACDLDNDGYPELLAASYGRAPNHLWHAVPGDDGSVGWRNESVASGYAYDDNRSWQDNQFARCFCADNRSAEGCADVPAPQISCSPNWNHPSDRRPFRLGGNSGATHCADLNNDGWMDLVTTEIRHWWAGEGSDGSALLYNRQESPPRFDRPSRAETGMEVPHVTTGGWDEGHMTATTLDVDNDGRLDLYLGASDYAGNRGLLYLQRPDGTFRLVSAELGIDHNRSHGVAVADFDRDGDLDVLVGHSRARCDAAAPNNCYETSQFRLFENVTGDAGNAVQLRLEGGPGTNRAAIGAHITVRTDDGLLRAHEVGGGYGHYGAQDDLVAHFGLGAACEAEVTVRWPNQERAEQTFRVGAGYGYHVREGEAPEVAWTFGETGLP